MSNKLRISFKQAQNNVIGHNNGKYCTRCKQQGKFSRAVKTLISSRKSQKVYVFTTVRTKGKLPKSFL